MKRCKHLDVRPDKDGKARVRKDAAYKCLWNEPVTWPPIPASWFPPFRYKELSRTLFTGRRYVDVDDCATCPVRENLK